MKSRITFDSQLKIAPVRISNGSGPSQSNSSSVPYALPFLIFSPQVTKELKSLDKKVVECTWDAKNKQWKFLRVREDKSFPNGYKTAMSKEAWCVLVVLWFYFSSKLHVLERKIKQSARFNSNSNSFLPFECFHLWSYFFFLNLKVSVVIKM